MGSLGFMSTRPSSARAHSIVEIDVFAEGQGRRHVNNDVTDEIAIAVDWSAAEGWNLPSPTPPDMGSMLSKTPRRTARGQQSKCPPWPRPSSPLYNYQTIAPRGCNALSQSEARRPSRSMGTCPGDPHHNFLRSRQWQKIRAAFLARIPCASTAPCSDAPPRPPPPITSSASSIATTSSARHG